MNWRPLWPALVTVLLPLAGIMAAEAEAPFSVVPLPEKVERGAGAFALTAKTEILADAPAGKAAEYLAECLRPAMGFPLAVRVATDKAAPDGCLLLTTAGADAGLGEEGYELLVTAQSVTVRAAKPAGLLYGVQTIRQLLPPQIEEGKKAEGALWAIPAVKITDRPRFGWRGLMLDVSRTFFGKECLKRYIAVLSHYKMNVLHLHLTDDQGWRLEIKKHPKLTEAGSKFAARFKEPPEREGFYSQDDIRELVKYAAARNVTLVPEIEMPGHALAALAVYPELSCTGGPLEIHPFFAGPGIHKEVFCAGNEKTFEVLQDVLTEVFELFPSQYIHIGGDECPKESWKACPKCQARKQAEKLKDEHELQSYFVRRIAKFIESKGRRAIGWDEILEGGLAENAAVMSWRGVNGGIAAARAGHAVVMSPTSHCYFDYENTKFPTRNVYSYEPVPAVLTPDQGKFVLGAQANFWSHIDRTEPRMDRQIFPRLLALAEVTWSPKESRKWEDFEQRVAGQYARLEAFKTGYYREAPIPRLALSVAPDGALWFVTEKNEILVRAGNAWEKHPGHVRQVAIGPDGTVSAVGTTPDEGGFLLVRRNDAGWTQMGKAIAGSQIAVAPDGALWAVNSLHIIWACTGGAWRKVEGDVRQIAIGADGTVYALGLEPAAGGSKVLKWTGGKWQVVAGAGAEVIAVAPDGALWTVNSGGEIRVLAGNNWKQIPGRARQLAISKDGKVYAVSGDAAAPEVLQWNGAEWQSLGKPGRP
ncbi:MAG: family 20 glycosylhydrolase [Planctomycetota bacterium]|nr:family 20 glycosylhydrolase [Planctomycetota bacterium]